jgi:hypothetical protein
MASLGTDTLLQLGIQAVMIAIAFGRLETRIAVLKTKMAYIEQRLKLLPEADSAHGSL